MDVAGDFARTCDNELNLIRRHSMPDEVPFRVALLAVMVLTMSVTVYHRWQAAAAGEPISRRAEGYAFAAVLRLAGLALWISVFAYLVAPQSIAWAALPLPAWLRWCGVGLGLASTPLMYWTLSSLGNNLTDTVVIRAEATLVTHGPYRYVRHPFYVAAALLMAAATLISANALIGALGLAVLALLAVRTPKEERMLIERFGDDYRRYMSTTGRFVPRWRR
jgi:protein-S-isoprenylcysteine O-methyltransferase Ste14